jgi:hypothetical protein
MGHIEHHTIIVAGSAVDVEAAHRVASQLFRRGSSSLVSPVVLGEANLTASFFVAPHGSKQGWDISNSCERLREHFIDHLSDLTFEDGSPRLDWFEARFGGDFADAEITQHPYRRKIDENPQMDEGVTRAYNAAESPHFYPPLADDAPRTYKLGAGLRWAKQPASLYPVLQQAWECLENGQLEWREVPVVNNPPKP